MSWHSCNLFRSCWRWRSLSFGLVLGREIGRARLFVLFSVSVFCLLVLLSVFVSRLIGCCLMVVIGQVERIVAPVVLAESSRSSTFLLVSRSVRGVSFSCFSVVCGCAISRFLGIAGSGYKD
jgi:hypothetical protein